MDIIAERLWELGEFSAVWHLCAELGPRVGNYAALREPHDALVQLLRYDPNIYNNLLYQTRNIAAQLRGCTYTFDVQKLTPDGLVPVGCPALLVLVINVYMRYPHPHIMLVTPKHSDLDAWLYAHCDDPAYEHNGHADVLVPYKIFTLTPSPLVPVLPKYVRPHAAAQPPKPTEYVYYIHNISNDTRFKIAGHARFCISALNPAELLEQINSAGPGDLLTFHQIIHQRGLSRG